MANTDSGSQARNLRVPADLSGRVARLASSANVAGVEAPWSTIAGAAMRRGVEAMEREAGVERPPPAEAHAA